MLDAFVILAAGSVPFPMKREASPVADGVPT